MKTKVACKVTLRSILKSLEIYKQELSTELRTFKETAVVLHVTTILNMLHLKYTL
jgi:hypothetical protein